MLYSHYVGGELRRPGRTYLYASAISLIVLVVLWVGVWALLRGRIGLPFMQAQANLGAVNPAAYGKITNLDSVAGGLGYGMILTSNPIARLLFATAVPAEHRARAGQPRRIGARACRARRGGGPA